MIICLFLLYDVIKNDYIMGIINNHFYSLIIFVKFFISGFWDNLFRGYSTLVKHYVDN